MSANNHIDGFTTTATSGTNTILTTASTYNQYFTGATTQTVKLPDVTTLVIGQKYRIVSTSSGTVTVQSSGGSTIQSMLKGTEIVATCIILTGTSAASWSWTYSMIGFPDFVIGQGGGAVLGNTAMGYFALSTNSGTSNSAFGSNALKANTGGGGNTAIGNNTLKVNLGGINNTALGNTALQNNIGGGNNTAIGSSALSSNTTGGNNVGVGSVLAGNSTGAGNSALGDYALNAVTTGNNSAVGYYALATNSTGANNTALGAYAGRYWGPGSTSQFNTGTTNSLFLGTDSRALTAGDNNEVVIGGYNSIGLVGAVGLGSNTTVIGNTLTTTTGLFGNIRLVSGMGTAPASSIAAGVLGDIIVTAGYIYVCTATNTWVRTALSTF